VEDVAHNCCVGDDPGRDDQAGVTDDDRQRYGLLLDRAAERGLLDTAEYQHRLGDLASATTIDQMQTIVTELPVFSTPGTTTRRTSSRSRSPAGGRGSKRWLVLALMLIVVALAVVFLAVYSRHVVNDRNPGQSARPVAARSVSGPRL
jgi:cytochrome c-type biogenesis protein CcmH/NrfG